MTDKHHTGPCGTQYGYRKGCRCEECIEASKFASSLASRRKIDPSYGKHLCGTRSGYNAGCRCNDCRSAHAQYFRDANQSVDRKYAIYLMKIFNLYGLSKEKYEELLKAQDHKCAICGVDQSELGYRLNVDHNHVTGEVRGLLCRPHNLALGKLQADNGPELVQNALTYLLG